MSKETLAELADLKKRIAEIEASLTQPEGHGQVFVPEGETAFCGITLGCRIGHPAFRTEAVGKAWQEALQIMLELRVQPGVEGATDCEQQWLVDFDNVCGIRPVAWNDTLEVKLGLCFSPCFSSREACEAAIAAVGPDRIRKAAETLAWVG